MNIAIVDDDAKMLETAERMVMEYGKAHGLELECKTYQQVEDYIRALARTRYSVVLMDVNFIDQEKTGFDAARELRKVDPECILIFLTDSEGHMPEAFSVHAFSYILKDRFAELLDPVLDDAVRLLPTAKIFRFVSDRQENELYYSDIVYACTDGHYIILTDTQGKEWRTRLSFSELTGKLKTDDGFLVINKGIVVNMNHINAIHKRDCVMNDGKTFPVRVRDSVTIAQTWRNYMFDSIRREQRTVQMPAQESGSDNKAVSADASSARGGGANTGSVEERR